SWSLCHGSPPDASDGIILGGHDFSRAGRARSRCGALAPEVSLAKPHRDRTFASGNTYFVATKTYAGMALFQSARVAELFLATLFSYREQRKFQVHEFVLMPNHLHLILTPWSCSTLERAMQLVKGGFSHRAGKELGMNREIWQRGYVDHRIRDSLDYFRHREYIRTNPVRAHLADAPDRYAYSSASPKFVLDPLP